MKTPFLIDVPKSAPTRRERLKAFIAKHKIVTRHCGGMSRKEHPWVACNMPSIDHFSGYGVTSQSDLFDVVSKVGRLADEAGCLVTGETERKAVEVLCYNMNIVFDP